MSKIFWKKQWTKNETSFRRIAILQKQFLLEGRFMQPGAESQHPHNGLQSPILCPPPSLSYSFFPDHSTLVRLRSLLYFRHTRQVLPLTFALLISLCLKYSFPRFLHVLFCALLQVIIIYSLRPPSTILHKITVASTPTLPCLIFFSIK